MLKNFLIILIVHLVTQKLFCIPLTNIIFCSLYQETSEKRVYIRAAGTSQLCRAHFEKMSKLWLPEDCSTHLSVRKQGTRDVFGYISSAHFSYTEACVSGVGYVTVEGLKQLIKSCQQVKLKQLMCLVRGTTTRHYRFASFKVNTEV